MIDFIKVQLTEFNISELENNNLLNLCYKMNPITGELKTKNQNGKEIVPYKNDHYKSLEFRIYDSGSVYILGSLHKFWNNGQHNYNDFNTIGVTEALEEIEQKFNIAPHQLKLRQLEIGVNFIPHYPTKELLKYCFLHKTKPFEWKYNSDEGKYIQVEHSQYIIKIYDKARHYRTKGLEVIEPEIMRFEIKYTKLEKLKEHNIYTIQDLIDYGLHNFVNTLITEWQKVLFYDFTINHNSKSLLNYKNPLYWQELKNRRSAYDKHKRKYKDIVRNHSNNLALEIENRILNKGLSLTQKGASIDQKLNELDTLKKKSKGANIDHLSIGSIQPPPPIKYDKNICKVTGLDISMQKDSFYLSHTGLKYYYQTDKKVFNQVKRIYLSDRGIKSDFQTQINIIAKNIRNKANNLKIKQKRIYPDDQYRLNIFK